MSSSLFQVELALGNLPGNQNKFLVSLERIYWLFASVSGEVHRELHRIPAPTLPGGENGGSAYRQCCGDGLC